MAMRPPSTMLIAMEANTMMIFHRVMFLLSSSPGHVDADALHTGSQLLEAGRLGG